MRKKENGRLAASGSSSCQSQTAKAQSAAQRLLWLTAFSGQRLMMCLMSGMPLESLRLKGMISGTRQRVMMTGKTAVGDSSQGLVVGEGPAEREGAGEVQGRVAGGARL